MANVWVRRVDGHVIAVTQRAGCTHFDEQLPADDPEVIEFNNRDPNLPWPDQKTWTADDRQRHEDDLELRKDQALRDATVVLIEFVDWALANTAMTGADFSPDVVARYQRLKAIADRLPKT